MKFSSLVIHGLSAISVYSEIVGIRMLIVSALLALFDLAGIGVIIFVRMATDLAIPGWATYSAGILTVLFWLILMMIFVLVFVLLSGRNTSSFLPKRDYSYFINEVRPHSGGPSQ